MELKDYWKLQIDEFEQRMQNYPLTQKLIEYGIPQNKYFAGTSYESYVSFGSTLYEPTDVIKAEELLMNPQFRADLRSYRFRKLAFVHATRICPC